MEADEIFEYLCTNMKLRLDPNKLTESYPQLLRLGGYLYIQDRKTGKESYVRGLARANYPRFHCYAKEESGVLTLDLHIDHKQTSYEGYHMHNAEYEGELVEAEITRLAGLAGSGAVLKSDSAGEQAEPAAKPMPKAYLPKTPEALGRYAGRPMSIGHGSLDDHQANTPKEKKRWWHIFR